MTRWECIFLFRCPDPAVEDVDEIARVAIFLSIPWRWPLRLSTRDRGAMCSRSGVLEITMIRDERFCAVKELLAHPILAGCFWVGLMPLMGAGVVGRAREADVVRDGADRVVRDS